ncbi:MAG: ChaN family lipoprotein [Acidobacteria bacterium]|nr:ChaN family lipoprotein [Acidobacteriota bacterium]
MYRFLHDFQHPGKVRRQARDYLLRLERLARRVDRHDSKFRTKYLQDYFQELFIYDDVVEPAEPLLGMVGARIICIGDFHVIPEYRHLQGQLLTRMQAMFPELVLGVEVFAERDQVRLNRWQAGELTDRELLRATHYERDWGVSWSSYARLLKTARELKIPIMAIDNEWRSHFRKIRRRDRRIAERIGDIAARFPGHKIVIVIGESHLAPSHLPRLLRQLLPPAGEVLDPLVLLFNHEALYYRLLVERNDIPPVIRAEPNVYCVFNLNPLVKYEYYLGFLESLQADTAEAPFTEANVTVWEFMQDLAKWLNFQPRDFRLSLNDDTLRLHEALPVIFVNAEVKEYLAGLKREGVAGVRPGLLHWLLALQGILYEPETNTLLVERFNTPFAAQEAGRFLFHNLKRWPAGLEETDLLSSIDEFYYGVLENAAAYLCSKRLYPLRNHYAESIFMRLEAYPWPELKGRLPFDKRALHDIARFVAIHKKYEVYEDRFSSLPLILLAGIHRCRYRQVFMQRELGFLLGEQLYQAVQARRRYWRKVLRLFFGMMVLPGVPTRLYHEFAGETKEFFDVRLLQSPRYSKQLFSVS